MSRWWTPLLIPAIVMTVVVLDLGRRGTHVSHSTYGSGFIGAMGIVVLVGYPAFRAGVRYAQVTPRS